jgi:luciferase family oxidoreductase group 1
MPVPWLLGSAYDSAQFAAEMGLGFSFAQFISPDGGQRVVREYRERFRPSPFLAEPLVSIGVHALCADTDEEAHRLGMSRHLMRLRRAQGRRTKGGVPSPEEALATEFNEPELDYIRYQQSLALEGGPERVREGLLAIADEYEADDVIIVTITHDYAARLRSYELVARAFGLSERADSLPPEPGSR